MKDFVESIIERDLTLAESILKKRIAEIAESKLHEMKKMMAARDFVKEQYPLNPMTGRSMTSTGSIPRSLDYAKRGLAEDDDSPFVGGDTEKVSNPKAKKENQAKKLAVKAMKQMKEKGK